MLPFLIAALLLTPPGTPSGGFRWQRIITPPPGAGIQQACVVLDAATFANAAPALNDLRLFQDGTELPYVIEESYDERALNSGVTPADDRSEYESVATIALHPGQPMGIVTGQVAPHATSYQGTAHLDPHIPVERLRLDPAPTWPSRIFLRAGNLARRERDEQLDTVLPAGTSTWAVTLGANLQQPVDVEVVVPLTAPGLNRVILETRKRSLCYQPRSASPLVLYLGGGQGISAKTYGLANGFSVSANRPYATMGPLEPNPDLQQRGEHPMSRLLIAVAVLAVTLLLTLWIGLELLRKDKGRPQATRPT